MPRAQLPPSFSVSTYAGKATGFPNVDRDGGGGGVLNGKNVLIFSDTITTNDAGAMVNFSSNSYAFVPNAKEPTKMQDVGSTSRPDVPAELVPWWGAEKCQTNFIWPNNPFTTKYNDPTESQAYAIYGVGLRSPAPGGTRKYNTLVSITASDAGLVIKRIIPQLYAIDGVDYGEVTTASHTDGNLYLFGNDGASGLKMAKVPWDLAARTSEYKYFTGGSNWSTDSTIAVPVLKTLGGAGVFSGEIFWSPFYNTWMMVSMTTFLNQFYIQYSEGGHIAGPWSAPVLLFDNTDEAFCNPDGSKRLNYAGHAYPQWLGTEVNELVLSWTYGGSDTRMALVTFS